MGRSHCCSKEGLNRGTWTAHEDKVLRKYIRVHGEGRWRDLPQRAGLKRCGKSCRLRWLNYLRPNIKRGNITPDEEDLIIRLHNLLGNRWSLIAGRLPGRTDNEIKNYWNTNLRKKVKDGDQSSGEATNANANNIENPMPHSASPPPHPSISMQSQNKKSEEAAMLNVTDGVISNTTTYDNGFLSFIDEEKELPLSTDFNVGDIYLSDLLNSDFGCTNNVVNNHHQLSSDQPHPIFSDEQLLKDSNSLHSFISFLDSTEE